MSLLALTAMQNFLDKQSYSKLVKSNFNVTSVRRYLDDVCQKKIIKNKGYFFVELGFYYSGFRFTAA